MCPNNGPPKYLYCTSPNKHVCMSTCVGFVIYLAAHYVEQTVHTVCKLQTPRLFFEKGVSDDVTILICALLDWLY